MAKKKRHLFTELQEGFDALEKERAGKLTLKRVTIEAKPKVVINSDEIIAIRKCLNMSQSVFAAALRIEKRTLERWEHGSGASGANAMLILMAGRYPDTLERVSGL